MTYTDYIGAASVAAIAILLNWFCAAIFGG